DGARVGELMGRFRDDRRIDLSHVLAPSREVFDAYRIDDDEVADIIAGRWHDQAVLVDPHTAVGLGAARHSGVTPMICLATADPAKFPDAVEAAAGVRPPLPPHLVDLL